MTLADKVEQLAMEYSLRIELSFDRRTRTRNLRLGLFPAANVFLTKLPGPILSRKSRDHINPKHAS